MFTYKLNLSNKYKIWNNSALLGRYLWCINDVLYMQNVKELHNTTVFFPSVTCIMHF